VFRWLSALWRRSDLSSVLLAALLSVGLMVLPEGAKLRLAQKGVPVLFFPFNRGVAFLVEQARLGRENRELREAVARSQTRSGQLRDQEIENAFWRRAYALQVRGRFRFVACEIIAKAAGMAVSTMVLNKGSGDGIRKNQPVIAPEGLIGKVASVGSSSCYVRTILDTTLHVGAMVGRTRRAGILEWDRGTDHCLLTKIPVTEDVTGGDEVLTSGLGGVFPPGVPIGRIDQVGKEPKGFFLDIVVSPYARLGRLSAALVIVGEDTTAVSSPDSLAVSVVRIRKDSLAVSPRPRLYGIGDTLAGKRSSRPRRPGAGDSLAPGAGQTPSTEERGTPKPEGQTP
jgi:rod shape-determining protein MreC